MIKIPMDMCVYEARSYPTAGIVYNFTRRLNGSKLAKNTVFD